MLVEDHQDWEEGGDALFAGARFNGPAWFYNARFAAAVSFTGATFADRFHLDHPTADLTGAATLPGTAVLPLGWTVDGTEITRDPSAHLTSDREDLRQPIVTALCALLRSPTLPPADRRTTQAQLTDRLRHRPGLHLNLCAATLVDLDLSGCTAAEHDRLRPPAPARR